MKPLLFQIGPIPIHSYGLMIVIGFLSGLWLAIYRGKKRGIDKEIFMDLGFYLLLSAMFGAKLLHVIIFWHDYVRDIPQIWNHPKELFTYLGSGLVFFGGLLFAIPAGIIYIYKKDLPLWEVADIFVPSIPLAHGFGRIGCFLAGCCYGKQCSLPWAVTFTNSQSLAPTNIPIHPTQLYSSITNFTIAGILLILSSKLPRYGQLFWTYLIIYPICRFIIEFYRDDPRGTVIWGLTTSQFIGIIVFIIAIIAQIIFAKRGKLRQ